MLTLFVLYFFKFLSFSHSVYLLELVINHLLFYILLTTLHFKMDFTSLFQIFGVGYATWKED